MANLIVYFSHAGENWVNGQVVRLEKGNTFRAAEIIRDAVGGDLFEVRAKEPYPDDYQALVARTKEEFENGLRPELAEYPAGLDEYDLIFIGYPIWWNTMPGPVFTFLSHYDWSGRRLALADRDHRQVLRRERPGRRHGRRGKGQRQDQGGL